MSLLSSFISDHLVPLLEKELVSHEPELQVAFIGQIQDLSLLLVNWVNEKLNHPSMSEKTK